jgi:uncharacterized protein YgbK (DUF1537 family)
MKMTLPEGILLAFYGDDFTGSTDAMEVTALAGLKTVLFTDVPDATDLLAFSEYPVVGIAGMSRARDPEWMDTHLPPAFQALASLSPRILQYKVCSTFDSAPQIGSIGKATELGLSVVKPGWIPSIVGAPQLGRWQVFGNLFAAAAGVQYRIDRHPTMSRHPVTPMDESDLRLHLARQTALPVGGIDLGDFSRDMAPAKIATAQYKGSVMFLDVADATTQIEAGRLVWVNCRGTTFSPSSSGLQYALVAHWRASGALPADPPTYPLHQPVDHLLVLSGSCSPVTADQIRHAENNGFTTIRLDVCKAATIADREAEIARVLDAVESGFESGAGVLVYAAKTVDDPAYAALTAYAADHKIAWKDAQAAIGATLGEIAKAGIPRFSLRRMVLAGGDTSGEVLSILPVKALEVKHPLSPGVPICRCHVTDPAFDGLELVLKGGQLGSSDLFLRALSPLK